MAIESVSRITARIKMSPKSRPISVFVVDKMGKRQLDAIYGNTVEATMRQKAVKPFHPSHQCPTCGHIEKHLAEEWLGNFHNEMNLKDVRNFLQKALES